MTEAGPVTDAPETAAPDAVERAVVVDMIRRSLPALPVLVLVAGLGWGWNGASSAALAIGIVLVNFLLAATMLAWAARISLSMLMIAAMGGFFVRLGLVSAVVFAVRDQPWIDLVPLCITLLVTHVGLLVWETRHVSASLAFPGVAPRPRRSR